MHRQKKDLNTEEQIQKLLSISENAFAKGKFSKGEAFLWKIKTIDSDYDVDAKLREVRSKNKKSRRSISPSVNGQHNNNGNEVLRSDTAKNFNNSVKTNNGTQKDMQKSTQNTVNANENNFIDNELKQLLTSVNEYFSSGSLDKAQLILNKAEELYIPADIKTWRHKIREAKLKIEEKNDERRRQKIESLKSEVKTALNYIENAKEAIASRDLVTTNKYLQDALDIITVSDENSSRNMKNNTGQKDRNKEKNKQSNENRRKASNVLEKEMQIEALKFIKEAEQAFFNYNFDEAEKLLLISKRITPDEYVEEMLALIENAKRESVSKERIEELRKTFSIKLSNTEQDYDFNNLDFEKTFKIVNGFDKAGELLKTIENLYTEEKAKEFFRQIQIATENQRPTNYYFGDNETTINESNKDEACKCLSRAKEAYCKGDFEKAKRLLEKSDRMYPTDEAKALLNDLKINHNEYEEEQSDDDHGEGDEKMRFKKMYHEMFKSRGERPYRSKNFMYNFFHDN